MRRSSIGQRNTGQKASQPRNGVHFVRCYCPSCPIYPGTFNLFISPQTLPDTSVQQQPVQLHDLTSNRIGHRLNIGELLT